MKKSEFRIWQELSTTELTELESHKCVKGFALVLVLNLQDFSASSFLGILEHTSWLYLACSVHLYTISVRKHKNPVQQEILVWKQNGINNTNLVGRTKKISKFHTSWFTESEAQGICNTPYSIFLVRCTMRLFDTSYKY